jgi:predicted nucleic acid-binding protein
VVLDSSVAISWYVEGPSSARAREVLPDSNAAYAAADHLLADVVDAMHRSGAYTTQEMLAATERLRADLVLEPVSPKMLKAAMAWMVHYDLPLQTLLPLALAREAGAPLLTCDAATVGKLREAGATDLLKDVVLLA